jgi:hypothetical protein
MIDSGNGVGISAGMAHVILMFYAGSQGHGVLS